MSFSENLRELLRTAVRVFGPDTQEVSSVKNNTRDALGSVIGVSGKSVEKKITPENFADYVENELKRYPEGKDRFMYINGKYFPLCEGLEIDENGEKNNEELFARIAEQLTKKFETKGAAVSYKRYNGKTYLHMIYNTH